MIGSAGLAQWWTLTLREWILVMTRLLPARRMTRVMLTLSVVLFSARLEAVDALYPIAVACSAEGPIYIADLKLPGILKLDGQELSVHYQASKQFRTPLNRVRCVTLDGQGQLWAGCTAARNVFKITAG